MSDDPFSVKDMPEEMIRKMSYWMTPLGRQQMVDKLWRSETGYDCAAFCMMELMGLRKKKGTKTTVGNSAVTTEAQAKNTETSGKGVGTSKQQGREGTETLWVSHNSLANATEWTQCQGSVTEFRVKPMTYRDACKLLAIWYSSPDVSIVYEETCPPTMVTLFKWLRMNEEVTKNQAPAFLVMGVITQYLARERLLHRILMERIRETAPLILLRTDRLLWQIVLSAI